nr:hypothetical protein [Tanacetum cinerariifolium]
MLADVKLPVTFWAEAVNTACYVKNRVLVSKPYNKIPCELFNERSHAIGFLRPFGCHVMILNTLDHLGKFDAKGDEGYFVGYSLSSKAFRMFNKRTMKIEENLHVDFLENKSIKKGIGPDCTKEDVHQAVKEKESPLRFIAFPNWFHEAQMASSNATASKDDAILVNNAPQQEQQEVNRDKEVPESSGNSNPTASTKVSTNDSFELALSSTVETEVPTVSIHVPTDSLYVPLITSSVPRIISSGGSSFSEPLSLGNAMSFENRLEHFFGDTSNAVCLNDVEVDLSNMETAIQNVWVLVDSHSGVRANGTKWVLKNKKDKRGIIIRNKARLVAQGHTQEEGIDYEEVFAPVARIEAIRLFLAYASYMGFTVYQMDIKSAFLYGTINEEIYVMQPPSFQDPEFPYRVYKVEKAMHGLHQAPKASYGTLSKYLLDNGFQRGTIDQTLFIRKHKGEFLLVQVYVNDIISGSLNPKLCTKFETLMHEKFQMSAMGELNFFLGLQVLQKKDGIFLSQDKYISDILKKIRYTDIRAGGGSRNSANGSNKDLVVNMCLNFLHGSDSEQRTHEFMLSIWLLQEAFPTDTSLDAGHDRENIAKTSAIPHEALLRVTSPGGGSRLLRIIRGLEKDLLRRMLQTQGVDQREDLLDRDKSVDKGSDNTNEMLHVLGILGVVNILASGGLGSVFTTTSLLVATARTARIHAKKELEMMFAELDRSNEMVAKHLAHIKKYQAQQNKLATKTEKRNFYMSILRSNAGWKAKDFKEMTFEQIEEKFIPVWEKMQDFMLMNSKLESKRLKKPRIQLDKERFKNLKTAKPSGTEPSQEKQSKEPKELSEEELKKMIELVPVEEIYIEALQVKYPIIDWEIYSEGQRKCWKIIRIGNHTEVYQIFEDMLKKFDREDLDKLWSLVKETCNTTEVTDKKAKELWVKLKRLYEPDSRDPLWALQRYMHDPLVWRLYDTCGVHHVSNRRGHQIFMLVEKDYPLTKGLTTLMLSNKLQVDQYSKIANELLMKIYIIANSPR